MSEVLEIGLKANKLEGTFELPLSKSMVNRALVLNALYPQISLSGISEAQDSEYLIHALQSYGDAPIFIGAGGTTLRFAAAYWATREGAEVILKGTEKLNSRPIAPLVEALVELGATIEYLNEQDCAPIKIKGAKLNGGILQLGHVESSQFVSALMLIAPTLEQGLRIYWDSMVSRPYLVMTAALLRSAGFMVNLERNSCHIAYSRSVANRTLNIEPDWSAIAFWCEAVALSEDANLFFPGFVDPSVQGDSKVVHYFEPLGVGHYFDEKGLHLFKKPVLSPGKVVYNLMGEPDLAQALVVSLIVRRIPFEISGLSTLRHKECDRIQWLVDFGQTLGVQLHAGPDSIASDEFPEILKVPSKPFSSHEDHRVAMSLAPLSLLYPISIEHPEVVAKSYPDFWEHWERLTPRSGITEIKL